MQIRTVKEGAELTCSYGIEKSCLEVPDDRGVHMQSGNQATIKDSVPEKNIFPFKYCKKIPDPKEIVTKVPDPETKKIVPVRICKPKVVLDWVNGKKDYLVKGDLALLNICIVPCIDGGIITIADDAGQSDTAGGEENED